MSSSPLSIRFDDGVLERLRRRAASRDTTPSGLAQRLVDEGLRGQEHPGVVFRDGPSGRRAALMGGADVWEIVAALRDSDLRGDEAVTAIAVDFDMSAARVQTALSYYGAYADEIDAQIAENERAADDALKAWQSRQRLFA